MKQWPGRQHWQPQCQSNEFATFPKSAESFHSRQSSFCFARTRPHPPPDGGTEVHRDRLKMGDQINLMINHQGAICLPGSEDWWNHSDEGGESGSSKRTAFLRFPEKGRGGGFQSNGESGKGIQRGHPSALLNKTHHLPRKTGSQGHLSHRQSRREALFHKDRRHCLAQG